MIGGIAVSRPIASFLLPTLYVLFDREDRAIARQRVEAAVEARG